MSANTTPLPLSPPLPPQQQLSEKANKTTAATGPTIEQATTTKTKDVVLTAPGPYQTSREQQRDERSCVSTTRRSDPQQPVHYYHGGTRDVRPSDIMCMIDSITETVIKPPDEPGESDSKLQTRLWEKKWTCTPCNLTIMKLTSAQYTPLPGANALSPCRQKSRHMPNIQT